MFSSTLTTYLLLLSNYPHLFSKHSLSHSNYLFLYFFSADYFIDLLFCFRLGINHYVFYLISNSILTIHLIASYISFLYCYVIILSVYRLLSTASITFFGLTTSSIALLSAIDLIIDYLAFITVHFNALSRILSTINI